MLDYCNKRTARLVPLQEYVPADKLVEVKRVLHGSNQGRPVEALDLPTKLLDAAGAYCIDLQGYKFRAAAEELRAPRIVKIGLVQHSIVKPTTAPFAEQRQVGLRACLEESVPIPLKRLQHSHHSTASAGAMEPD